MATSSSGRIALFLFAMLAAAGIAPAQSNKLAKDLQHGTTPRW